MSKSLRGIHVDHCKNTENCATEIMPIPDKVVIPMCQNMGAPCEPLVKLTNEVKVGQIIGDTDSFVSAPIHSSVSGKVTGMEEITLPNGNKAKAIVITTDKEQTISEDITAPVVTNQAEFITALRASGLVGQGGAGFPTHIKFNPKNLSDVDTLVINAAECEPYITSDDRCMLEDTDYVIEGAKAIKKYLDLKNVIIGIESNKPASIKLMSEKTANLEGFSVATLKSQYPQGGEKVLAYETTGKIIEEGKLPCDVGLVIANVTTVAFVAKYLETGMPLISKRVTVDGGAVNTPKNVLAPIGASFNDVIEFCGGYKSEPKKIISGGPMMGTAVRDGSALVTKGVNAILAMDEHQCKPQPETPCIRCNRCADTCPYSLMPAAIERSYKAGNVDALKALKVNLCMSCGCCSYVCPAKRELVVTNNLAMKLIRN